jgi:hypothetical protein
MGNLAMGRVRLVCPHVAQVSVSSPSAVAVAAFVSTNSNWWVWVSFSPLSQEFLLCKHSIGLGNSGFHAASNSEHCFSGFHL